MFRLIWVLACPRCWLSRRWSRRQRHPIARQRRPNAFDGTWTMEQIPPGGTPRRQGTLVIVRNGNALFGTMRLNGIDVPLANVGENGGIVSFSVPVPDSPGLVVNYSGAIQGNQLGVASQDLGNGSYTLTARRTGGSLRASGAGSTCGSTSHRPAAPRIPRAGDTTRPAGRTGAAAAPRRSTAGIGRAATRSSRRLCRAPAGTGFAGRGTSHPQWRLLHRLRRKWSRAQRRR